MLRAGAGYGGNTPVAPFVPKFLSTVCDCIIRIVLIKSASQTQLSK